MNICFSCRVAFQDDALHLNVGSDKVCGRCYLKFGKEKAIAGDDDLEFEKWRTDVTEGFGFDPYLERDTDIALYAKDACALVPVCASVMELLAEIQETCPGLEASEIIEQGLGMVQQRIYEVEKNAMNLSGLAKMIGISVATALRQGLDPDGKP